MTTAGNARAHRDESGAGEWREEWSEFLEAPCGYGEYGRRRAVDLREGLAPLVARLGEYDAIRRKMEIGKWGSREIRLMNLALTSPLVVKDWWGRPKSYSLANQQSVREALFDLDDRFDIHLQVRKNNCRMPMFYLVKIRASWHCESRGIVVQDLYRSPDYPLGDDRFAPLMAYSRERYYLRMSQFREKCMEMLEGDEGKADSLLVDLGAGIFEPAWDLYQQIGYLLSKSFGLKRFFSALEVLYLVLSADLSDLRSRATAQTLLFFEKAYPDSAIPDVLECVADMDGQKLERMAQKARNLYPPLLQAFGEYLETQVSFKKHSGKVPFYKLAFSNIHSLDKAAKWLKGDNGLGRAAQRLEDISGSIIGSLAKKGCRL